MAFVCCVTSAFGKKRIEAYGDTKVLKENATAHLVLDFSRTTWEGGDSYMMRLGDKFPDRERISTMAFKRYFNATTKGLRITDDPEAKYEMIFRIMDLEQHMSGFLAGRFSKNILGMVEIIDNSTQKIICRISIKRIEGDADFSIPGRIEKAYGAVAVAITDL